MTTQHEQHVVQGVIFGILGAISYTLMSIVGKYIGNDASNDTMLFARFSVSLFLILPWILKNPKAILHIPQPTKVLSRSIFTFLAFGCFFYSIRYLSLANALLLNNTTPLFIPLIVWSFFKMKTPPTIWLGIILGFIGVGLALDLDQFLFQPASLAALASGFIGAFAVVLVRSLTKIITVTQILFYHFLICTLLSAILLPFDWQPITLETAFLLFLVGIFGAGYQAFSTLAYAKAPTRITAHLMFLCIVFGLIADHFLWGKTAKPTALLGMATVILGGCITIYYGQKELMAKKK